MKTLIPLLVSLLTLSVSAITPADKASAEKAADLFKKSLKAGGGVAAAKAVKTRIMTGTMNMNQMGEWKMVITSKAPNFERSEVTVPEYGVVTEACDGVTAWKLEPGKPLELVKGYELLEKKREARFYRGIELMTEYQTVKHKGQQKIKGKLYEVIEATYEDDPNMTFFLHADTHLIGMVKAPGLNNSQVTITISDYRKLDNQLVPYRWDLLIENKRMPEPMAIVMKFSDIVHNKEVDNKIFAAPKKTEQEDLAVP